MKAPLIALIALLAAPAFAGQETSFYCHGIDNSAGKMLFVKALSNTDVPENYPMSYLVVIRDGSKTLFEAAVTAKQEDVMLSFASRAGSPKLSGIIYLDEYDQTSMTLGRMEMRFDCNPSSSR